LESVDVVGVLLLDVDFGAGAVSLEIGSTSGLVLGNLVPFAFVIVD
jgi:hypothetical protein